MKNTLAITALVILANFAHAEKIYLDCNFRNTDDTRSFIIDTEKKTFENQDHEKYKLTIFEKDFNAIRTDINTREEILLIINRDNLDIKYLHPKFQKFGTCKNIGIPQI